VLQSIVKEDEVIKLAEQGLVLENQSEE